MDEITLDDKTYVSSKRAAQITGYAKDYVGQLCREGRVEARLVGRNWYVLEESIRVHRFGAEEKKPEIASDTKAAASISTWEPPNYTKIDPPELIPTLISQENRSEINVLEGRAPSLAFKAPEIDTVNSKVVTEMQSAWQDWFSRTNELQVSQEVLLENTQHDLIEQEEMPLEASNLPSEASFDGVTTPITLEKVTEAIEDHMTPQNYSQPAEEEAEVVRVRRKYVATPRPTTTYTPNREVTRKFPSPEGRIIRERRVIRRKKPSVLLKAFLFLIALLVVVITLIGTGKIDSVLSATNVHYAPIQYLGGESSFTKPSI